MTPPVVLITGALTGIGYATALAFAKNGAKVVVTGRHAEKGHELVRTLESMGTEALFCLTDVRVEADLINMVEQTIKRFGRLDVAVNNAGIEGELAMIVDQTAAGVKNVFDTNIFGVMMAMKHELRVMVPQKSGSIINISSVVGQVGTVAAAAYCASKHAVEGLTKSAALEAVSAGVCVNAVAPGPVDTDMLDRFAGHDQKGRDRLIAMTPARRVAAPDEIAQTIIFLASNKAPALTGQIIAIDGGYTAR